MMAKGKFSTTCIHHLEQEGLTVMTPAEASAWADVIMILVPDTAAAALYRDAVAPNLKPGKMVNLVVA